MTPSHRGKANRNRLDITAEALWQLAVVPLGSFTVYFMVGWHVSVVRKPCREDYKTDFLRHKDGRNDEFFTLLRFGKRDSPFFFTIRIFFLLSARRAAWWLALSPRRGGAFLCSPPCGRGLSPGAPASTHSPKTHIGGKDAAATLNWLWV